MAHAHNAQMGNRQYISSNFNTLYCPFDVLPKMLWATPKWLILLGVRVLPHCPIYIHKKVGNRPTFFKYDYIAFGG